MQSVTKSFEFEAAHRLVDYPGHCKNVHGHQYKIEITLSYDEHDALGMGIDFGEIKKLVGGWVNENWDHAYIAHPGDIVLRFLQEQAMRVYVMPPGQNPTAEYMAKELYHHCCEIIPLNLTIENVRLYETPTSWADYK